MKPAPSIGQLMPDEKRGIKGDFSSAVDLNVRVNVNDKNPEIRSSRITGVDVGGVRGGPVSAIHRRPRRPRGNREPRTQPRIYFWHEIFRHINASHFRINGHSYPWQNSDRKILANAARKYGAFDVMAIWDIFAQFPGRWQIAGMPGTPIFWMVRNSGEIMDHPSFKNFRNAHRERLEADLISASDILSIALSGINSSQERIKH